MCVMLLSVFLWPPVTVCWTLRSTASCPSAMTRRFWMRSTASFKTWSHVRTPHSNNSPTSRVSAQDDTGRLKRKEMHGKGWKDGDGKIACERERVHGKDASGCYLSWCSVNVIWFASSFPFSFSLSSVLFQLFFCETYVAWVLPLRAFSSRLVSVDSHSLSVTFCISRTASLINEHHRDQRMGQNYQSKHLSLCKI